MNCLIWMFLPQLSPGERTWRGRRPWQAFLLACYWQSIFRLPARGSQGTGANWVLSTPCSQRTSGNLTAEGNNTAKLPMFILHGRVIQVAFCFQHARLTFVPIFHVEWEIAGELFCSHTHTASTVKITDPCFMRLNWDRRTFNNIHKQWLILPSEDLGYGVAVFKAGVALWSLDSYWIVSPKHDTERFSKAVSSNDFFIVMSTTRE